MTGKIYIANAFSLSMIETPCILYVSEIPLEILKEQIRDKEIISAIGHESTAKLLSQLLEREIPVNRIMIKLQEGDELYVMQVLVRLPEGKILSEEEIKKLLEEKKIKFFKVTITTP